MAAEGLKGMMINATRRNLFNGFKLNEQTTYNLVQFADDTLIVGEATWENLWAIKAMLRCF